MNIKTISIGLLPILGVLLGSVIGYFVKIPDIPKSVLLSISAGLLSSALFTDISSDVVKISDGSIKNKITFLSAGLIGGAILMVALRQISLSVEKSSSVKNKFPIGSIVTTAIDLFIDSFLVGKSVGDGKLSIGLTGSFTIEALIVCLSIMANMKSKGNNKQLIIAIIILTGSAMLGFVTGIFVGPRLPKTAETALTGATISVLLNMIVMDLIPEAMESGGKDNWWVMLTWFTTIAIGIGSDWMLDN